MIAQIPTAQLITVRTISAVLLFLPEGREDGEWYDVVLCALFFIASVFLPSFITWSKIYLSVTLSKKSYSPLWFQSREPRGRLLFLAYLVQRVSFYSLRTSGKYINMTVSSYLSHMSESLYHNPINLSFEILIILYCFAMKNIA